MKGVAPRKVVAQVGGREGSGTSGWLIVIKTVVVRIVKCLAPLFGDGEWRRREGCWRNGGRGV